MNRSFVISFVAAITLAHFTFACSADTSEAATEPSEQVSSNEAAGSANDEEELHGGVNPSLTEMNGGVQDQQSPFTQKQEIEAAKIEASNLHHGASVEKPAKNLASPTMAISPKK